MENKEKELQKAEESQESNEANSVEVDNDDIKAELKAIKEKLETLQPQPPKYIEREEEKKEINVSPVQIIDKILEDVNRKYEIYKNPEVTLLEEFVRIAVNSGISKEQIAKDIATNMTGLPQSYAHLATAAKLIE